VISANNRLQRPIKTAPADGERYKRKMKKKYIRTTIGVFVLLSILSLLIWNGPPLRVHAVDITAFFFAFVVPGLLALYTGPKKEVIVWLLGGAVGIFLWDAGSALVMLKRELFMGWYVLYPLGLIGLVLLQLAVKYISGKAFL
jgi:hypothetical protein